jgi:small subunit ribosomal protein S9
MWDVLLRRQSKGDYYDPNTWEVFLQVSQIIDQTTVDQLDILGLAATEIELQGLSVITVPLQEWRGWGRFKSAIARAVLRPGSGTLRVNGEPVWEYFKSAPSDARGFLHRLLKVGEVQQTLAQIDGFVRVEGSGPESKRQARAVAHALARALAGQDSGLGKRLNRMGFGGVRVKHDERH